MRLALRHPIRSASILDNKCKIFHHGSFLQSYPAAIRPTKLVAERTETSTEPWEADKPM